MSPGDELAIEEHMDVLAHDQDAEAIPFTDRFVGDFKRQAGILLVIVKRAGADFTARLRRFCVRIPNLNLR